MAEFLAGYSGLLDAISFVFVVVSLAGFALTASFSKASLTLVADLAYPVGLLGSLLGWVIMLTNLSDPQAVGPALAISFLTVLYAAVIHGLASGRSRDLSEIISILLSYLYQVSYVRPRREFLIRPLSKYFFIGRNSQKTTDHRRRSNRYGNGSSFCHAWL